jgi:hypothetical protein
MTIQLSLKLFKWVQIRFANVALNPETASMSAGLAFLIALTDPKYLSKTN